MSVSTSALPSDLWPNVEGRPAGPGPSSSSNSGGGRSVPPPGAEGPPSGSANADTPEGLGDPGPREGTGCQPDGLSVAGEAVYPEDSTEDVGEEMYFLHALIAPEELGKEREDEAV
eukprot:9896786-Alexandrium_andersonii.AAC.1